MSFCVLLLAIYPHIGINAIDSMEVILAKSETQWFLVMVLDYRLYVFIRTHFTTVYSIVQLTIMHR